MENAQPISDGLTTALAPVTTGTNWTREQIDLIKSTVAKGTTDSEFALFLYISRRTGLDPLAKQIHAVKRWNRAENRETMSVQTAIDGYRLIAARTGQHMGTDDAVFDVEGAEHPNKATVTVYRMVQGQRVGFTASVRWAEYVQTTKDGSPNSFWFRMPYGQLGKCCEALALRKAFPAELSNVYTHDEMMQADNEPRQPFHPLTMAPKLQLTQPLTPAPKPQDQPPAQSSSDTSHITAGQQKRLFPLLRDASVSVDNFKAFLLAQYQLEHTKDITGAQYEDICRDITGGGVTAWVVSNQEPVEAEQEPGAEG